MLHKNVPAADVHAIVAFTYANAAARTGATGLVAGDVGKCALQSDNSSVWFLVSVSPVTWSEITNTGGSLVTSSRTLTAGAGLTGGGDLSADRTFDIVAADSTITVNADSIQVGTIGTTNVANNAIDNTKIRDSVGVSVIGRSANSTGDPADIVAGADGQFLRRASGALGFGAITTGDLPGTVVLSSRNLIAGAGMTGGGDLTADRTFDVVANADGSIVVNPNDIQVGVISDTQHGNRTGGSLHALAVASLGGSGGSSGFLAAFDKEKLNQFKVYVRVATTANITLSGLQTIDGVALSAGDRVLVKNQTTTTQNGIYDASSGAWTRSFDAAATGDFTGALVVMTREGTTNDNIFFTLATNNVPVVGTDPITFTQLSGVPGTATPANVATVAAVGTSVKYAHEDHAHTVGANVISDAMLRQGAATSVVGRSAGSTGNVADIAAGADGQFLRRSAGVLGFGAITTGDLPGTVVLSTRNLIAGAGLTGGGDLSADRTFNVVAADSSITVNADSIQVGVISDTQHGNRGGGSLHSVATPSVNGSGGSPGFMAAFDKEKVDQFKVVCLVATTGNITLSGLQTIDGVALSAGDRVLVRAQTTTTENGIYNASAGAWTRAFDAAVTGDITPALVVMIKSGTIYNDIFWTLSGTTAPVIGTDPIVFAQLSGVPGSTAPQPVGTSAVVGTSVKYAHEDHAHAHGAQTDGTLHAVATVSVDGFMPATDKKKLNNIPDQLKQSCRIASTANLGLSGLAAIDGITPVANDRILVKNQTTASQNGIYLAASGAWTRATDFDESAEVTSGLIIDVEQGTAAANTSWRLSTANPITLGSTNLTFSLTGGLASSTTPANVAAAGAVGTGITWARADHVHTIGSAIVTKAMMANGTALSVIGRSANSAGVTADIAATAASNAVLRESGSTIGWGLITTANITAANITDALLRNSAATSVIGRSANSTGVPADIAAGADGQYLRRSAGVLGFGAIALSELPSGVVLERYPYGALDLVTPNTADWGVNAFASVGADTVNSAYWVRRFDDTIEEGVGFTCYIPPGAVNMVLKYRFRAESAPPATRTVGLKLYRRLVPNNAAVPAWASAQITDVSVNANANWTYGSQTVTLSSMSQSADTTVQFELTRVNPVAGTELVGDWDLTQLIIEFT